MRNYDKGINKDALRILKKLKQVCSNLIRGQRSLRRNMCVLVKGCTKKFGKKRGVSSISVGGGGDSNLIAAIFESEGMRSSSQGEGAKTVRPLRFSILALLNMGPIICA